MQIAVLASGSSGNCIYVQAGSKHLLIDVGISNRAVCRNLATIGVSDKQIDAVLVTHEHSDHLKGMDVFARRHMNAAFYANAGTWHAGKRYLCRIDPTRWQPFETHRPFQIGEVNITPFAISHDATDPVGYKIEAEGKKVIIATDLGMISQGVFQHLQSADALVIEANHDKQMLENGPYPVFLKRRIAGKYGHLSNDITGKLLQKIINRQTQLVILAHLSDKNNTPAKAYQTVFDALQSHQFQINKDYQLLVAPRYEVTPLTYLQG